MRKISTLICIALIGFVGSSIQLPAQMDTSSLIQSMMTGETLSTTDIVGEVAAALMETTPIEQPLSSIEGQLVSDVVVREVNQTVAAALIGDVQTGRYPPRLKINFAEYPLRSIEATNSIHNGRNGLATDAIVQRIQDRLRISQVNLVVQDRTAIISGTVATQRQRDLVGSVLRFEPGIDVVNNELTVSP